MSKLELAAILITAILALSKLFVQVLQKTDKSLTWIHFWDGIKKHESLDALIGNVMLGFVMAVLLSIFTGVLPKLEEVTVHTELLAQNSEKAFERDIFPRLDKLELRLKSFITLAQSENVQEIPDTIGVALKTVDGISDPGTKRIFGKHFSQTASSFKQELVSISSSKINIPKTLAQDFAEDIVDVAHLTLDAASLVDPEVWWDSTKGKAYLELNRIAAGKKNVHIRRIFGWKTPKDKAAVERIARIQKAAGIEVYLVEINTVEPEYREDLITQESFFLFTMPSGKSAYFAYRFVFVRNVPKFMQHHERKGTHGINLQIGLLRIRRAQATPASQVP
jgi:hypothetical protein